jgi:pectinesterase
MVLNNMKNNMAKTLSLSKGARRAFVLANIACAMSCAISFPVWAGCSYSVTNNWGSGFTGEVTVTNNTGQSVSGWSVSWSEANASITNVWNAGLNGANPYTATSLAWNGNLAPGATTSFGFQAVGIAGAPSLLGSLCGASASSVAASSAPKSASSKNSSSKSSVAVSSMAKTSSSSSSVAVQSSLVMQESQAGFCSVDGTIDDNNSGFTATGFANTTNAQGTAIRWAINASTSSRYQIRFRYANGGSTSRNGSLLINGGSNGNYTIELPTTGAWTNWQIASISVDLVQGNNNLQLSALTADGLANIDSLTVIGAPASPGICAAVASSKASSSKPSSSSAQSSSIQSGTPDCNSITNQPILTVATDGSAQYRTVQAALNSLSSSNTTPTQIRIKPGVYREKLSVTKPKVTFCGQLGKEASTVLTYGDGASTLKPDGTAIGTSGSASITIQANDISVENISIENSFGVGSQAVALYARGDRLQFRNCRLLGNQDTLYAHSGTQYYRNCYIQGTVDFIFCAATAVFENNTIHSVGGGSALTAPSTDQNVPYGLVFLGGKVTAVSSVAKGSVALGRNWRPYGAAAYIRTELGQHIAPVGWVKMSENTLDTARFSEYLTTGAGANPSARAAQSQQLSAAQASVYTLSNIFGSWSPSFSQ